MEFGALCGGVAVGREYVAEAGQVAEALQVQHSP